MFFVVFDRQPDAIAYSRRNRLWRAGFHHFGEMTAHFSINKGWAIRIFHLIEIAKGSLH